MDIPDSLCEVVLSFCLLVVTHTGLRQLVSILADELDLPEPPKAERGPDRVADDDGPDGTRYRFCSHIIGFTCHCDANDSYTNLVQLAWYMVTQALYIVHATWTLRSTCACVKGSLSIQSQHPAAYAGMTDMTMHTTVPRLL